MNRTGRLLAGLATATAIAALVAVAAPALAQDSQGVTLLRDTEIEGILHQEADPIFTAAGLDAK
ncbi:MAG: M48 family peptidase, partial [Caulobacteraceae bacterium]